jgi:hypothetical protein
VNRGVQIVVGLLCVARTVFAQDARLSARLDKPTLTAVTAIVDSARISKLPTAPLIDKALEGAAKGSDGQNIITAVHQLSVRMGSAKRALASNATPDEINAAASALDAGISVRDLARLRAAAGKRSLTLPLAVLTDLVGEKVPIPTATNLVLQLVRSGVKDAELAMFQRNFRADVDHGADPTVAATTRARGLVVARGGGATTKPPE